MFCDPGAELRQDRLRGEGLGEEILQAATSLHSSFPTFPVPTEMLSGRLVRKKVEILGSIAPQGTQGNRFHLCSKWHMDSVTGCRKSASD